MIDHLMYAVPDLDEGMARIADMTGVKPVIGGPHPGQGTRNALLSLGENSYLEIISLDPDQDVPDRGLGKLISELRVPVMQTWAVAVSSLSSVEKQLQRAGIPAGPIVDMTRRTPNGDVLEWQLLLPEHSIYHQLFPFFIDWKGSAHPAKTSPAGAELVSLTIGCKEPQSYDSLMRELAIQVDVVKSETPVLTAKLSTPRGEVVLF